MEEEMKAICDRMRVSIKDAGEEIKNLLYHSDFDKEETYPDQHAEMKANIMLTYRHLEDARMRIGKILQAAGDGVSIHDK